MRRPLSLAILLYLPALIAFGQVRVGKLVLKTGEVYTLSPSDIIVADTLIMMDSSRIVLNGLKRENYIRVGVAILGNHCVIDGEGIHGKPGKPAKAHGIPQGGPCQTGLAGRNGLRGLDGGPGTDLFLYIDKIRSTGRLTIILSGGNGGNGGDGATGGGGNPGTVHCHGGDGGRGGDGGSGGYGGNGGNLTVGGTDQIMVRSLIGNQIVVLNRGGNYGYGGISGPGGPSGRGPGRKNGKEGAHGINGHNGHIGYRGTIHFEDIDKEAKAVQ
jgi:hypothetical protein